MRTKVALHMAPAIWWLLFALTLPAFANVTLSGRLISLDRQHRILILQQKDGHKKRVKLVGGAKFEIAGRPTTINAFRQGMQVSVRLCSALNDDPLLANILMDIGTSSKYVKTTARAPYYTRHGDFATTAGAGGRPPGLPMQNPATTIGILGNGGQLPNTPYNNPYASKALNPFPINQGSRMSLANNLANSTATSLMGIEGDNNTASLPGYLNSTPVQIQGVIVSANPTQRLLVIQPVGSATPQNVILSPTAQIPPQAMMRGSLVNITGVPNPNGYVEATAVSPASASPTTIP